MANSFTIPFMISFMICLVVAILGGSEYQLVKTGMINKLVNVDNNYQFNNESFPVGTAEGSVDVSTTTLGFIDGLKLVLQFIFIVPMNAIAMPITIFTIGGFPLALKVLFGIPLGLLTLLGVVGLVRGAL